MCFLLYPKHNIDYFPIRFSLNGIFMNDDCVFFEVWTEYLYRQFLCYVMRNLRKLGLKQKILNYGNLFI